jgi:hypothetical protein
MVTDALSGGEMCLLLEMSRKKFEISKNFWNISLSNLVGPCESWK